MIAGGAPVAPASPAPLTPSGLVLRRHLGEFRDEIGKILGARHGVILEAAGDELALGVEHDRFHQRLAGALRDAAVDLALAEQRDS